MKGQHKEIERSRRIDEVMETLLKLKSGYNTEKLIMEICTRYSVTERKAKEYIKFAEYKIEYGKNPKK